MDSVDFFYPTTNKLLIYLLLVVIFLVRWSDNVNELDYQCLQVKDMDTGEVMEKCSYTGELKRHVGFPLETYKVYVSKEVHYNYFYDFNFAADLGIWYVVACLLNFLLGTVGARKVEEKIVHKIREHRR